MSGISRRFSKYGNCVINYKKIHINRQNFAFLHIDINDEHPSKLFSLSIIHRLAAKPQNVVQC